MPRDRRCLLAFQEIEIDFVADNPGMTPFHAINSCTWILDPWHFSIMRDT